MSGKWGHSSRHSAGSPLRVGLAAESAHEINEELDALTTMGLSPMRFLVVPKLLSSLTMVPLMIIFFNFASLIGGAVVMLSMGFPLVTFTSRVFTYLSFGGFFSGMLKGLVLPYS